MLQGKLKVGSVKLANLWKALEITEKGDCQSIFDLKSAFFQH